MKTLTIPLRLLVVVWMVLGWVGPGLAAAGPAAQVQPPNVHIHNVLGPAPITDNNGLPGLRMTMDFTLLNDAGEVMPGIAIQSATIDLEDGSHNPSPVTETTEPWTVGVLVDNSRTLFLNSANTSFKAIRGDIIEAVGALPDGTNVGVLTFEATTVILEDFTADKTKVQTALSQRWRPQNNPVSCLYAGALKAVTELGPKPGRKALVIVTASANSCGDLPQAVIDAANLNDIQIYGVAVRGFAAVPQELQILADATGGLVDTRNANDINFSFANITNALSLQRRATTTLYPSAGPHLAVLSLLLSDNSVIKSPEQAFESPGNFEAAPVLNIQGVPRFDKDVVLVNLAMTSVSLIDHVLASVLDPETGDAVVEAVRLPVQQGQNRVSVPPLTVGKTYQLQLTMMNAGQTPIGAPITSDFKVEAIVPGLDVALLEVPGAEEEGGDFVVSVQPSNLDDLRKYRVALVASGTVAPVEGTVNIVPADFTIRIPVVEKLPSGQYQVLVEPQAQDGTVLLQARLTEAFEYVAPDPRAIFFRNLRNNPVAIAGITVATALGCLGVVAVVFFLVSAARPRQARLPKSVDLALPEVKRRAPAPVLDSGSMRAPNESKRPARPSARRPGERPPADRSRGDASRAAPEQPVARTQNDASYSQAAAPMPSSAAPVAAAGGMPKACLTSHTPPELRLTGRITKTPFTIGRAGDNDMVVQVDNRVGVSGKHASVIYDKGRFFIIDQKSTYGTTLNDHRLAPNTPTPLEEGVLIGLGPKIKVKFSLQDCG